jgi:hypothetical protein
MPLCPLCLCGLYRSYYYPQKDFGAVSRPPLDNLEIGIIIDKGN